MTPMGMYETILDMNLTIIHKAITEIIAEQTETNFQHVSAPLGTIWRNQTVYYLL